MSPFVSGLATGLVLQLAIGPVYFFIVTLTLRGTILDGLAGVAAVTLVDFFYIALAIFGIGRAFENRRVKRAFGILSSVALILFGSFLIWSVLAGNGIVSATSDASNPLVSFASVFLLTISSPMTIVFFTSLFAAKAVEHRYAKKDLHLFGLGTGTATLLFMGASVLAVSFARTAIPVPLVQALNAIVGFLLIGYGGARLMKTIL